MANIITKTNTMMTNTMKNTIELLREIVEESGIIFSKHFSIEHNNHSCEAMPTLSYLDLSEMDLSDTDFSNLAFVGVNFSDCELKNVIFKNCIFKNCTFTYADLINADFENTVMNFCNFYNANMSHANFSKTTISECNFAFADLMYSCFTNSFFTNNNLRGAWVIDIIDRPYIPLACPEEGEFIGWKKVWDEERSYLIKLKIPKNAKRSSATTNKCRCDMAEVLSIQRIEYDESMNYKLTDSVDLITNYNFCTTIYKVGETVLPDSFDEDRFQECYKH